MPKKKTHRPECEEQIFPGVQEESVVEPPAEEDPLAILIQERDQLKDAYLRLSADMDNYRKRILKEKEDYQRYAVKGIIEKILPVLDNFGRCLKAEGDTETLKQGAEMILSQLEGVLAEAGLQKIGIASGDEFNPELAEALMMEENSDAPHSLTVGEVFENGWQLGDQVLRTAKVKVYKK